MIFHILWELGRNGNIIIKNIASSMISAFVAFTIMLWYMTVMVFQMLNKCQNTLLYVHWILFTNHWILYYTLIMHHWVLKEDNIKIQYKTVFSYCTFHREKHHGHSFNTDLMEPPPHVWSVASEISFWSW